MPESLPQQVSISDIDAAPTSVATASDAQTPGQYAELLSRFTIVSNENFTLKSDIEDLKKGIRTAQILDSLIKPYAGRAFIFMCSYCAFVGILLLLSGWSKWSGFAQPKEVLSLMVGSTAVTVIGLVGMVLTGIFVGARKGGT